MPTEDSNKSHICMFYKIVIDAETPVDESVSHKLKFICQKHICWVKFQLFISTPHLIVSRTLNQILCPRLYIGLGVDQLANLYSVILR